MGKLAKKKAMGAKAAGYPAKKAKARPVAKSAKKRK